MAPIGAAPHTALNPPTRSDAATFAIARKSFGKFVRAVFVDILPESWCVDPETGRSRHHPAHQGHCRCALLRQSLRDGASLGGRAETRYPCNRGRGGGHWFDLRRK